MYRLSGKGHEKIKETIIKTKEVRERFLKPFTKKELIERAEKSNKDYLSGKFKTQELLEMESWDK
jgi:hypothetical protein